MDIPYIFHISLSRSLSLSLSLSLYIYIYIYIYIYQAHDGRPNHGRKKHDQLALKFFPDSSQDRPQIVPRGSQNTPKKGLGRLLGPSQASPEGPRSAQEHQDAPKTGPRVPQERTRAAQERPRERQLLLLLLRAAKRRPREAQDRPKQRPGGSKKDPKYGPRAI